MKATEGENVNKPISLAVYFYRRSRGVSLGGPPLTGGAIGVGCLWVVAEWLSGVPTLGC